MSDIDAPMRYADPAEDSSTREGSIGLIILLALGLAVAGVAIAMLSRESAEPFVLSILAGLSVIGVFSLFAGAAGILRFSEQTSRNDITKAFVDNLPHGALITRRDGAILYANEAYRRLVGGRVEGAVPSVERVFAGQGRIAEQIFRLSRAARQGRSWSEEFPMPRLPGGEAEAQPRWIRVSVWPCPAKGLARGGLTVWEVADITGERRQEDDAFDKLQQVIEYLDAAPAGFCSADRKGRIEYLNATLAQWLGLELAEVATGELQLTDIAGADAAAMLLRAGEDDSRGETRRLDLDLKRRDGTGLPVRILLRTLSIGDGYAGLSHMLVLNRSQGAEASEDGRAAEVRFARFFQSAPIGIATVDAQGRIGSTNARFASMFARVDRYTPGHTTITSLVGQESRAALEKAIAAAVSGQTDIEPVEATFGENGERTGRFFVSSVEHPEDGGEAALIYAIDTTQQRALEMQIAQSQKMQAVGQLAGGIAHDFNNLLTAIIGFSEMLLGCHRPTDPAFQDIMNIKQSANRAAGLVRQLLAFSRRQTLQPEVLSFSEVLGDLSILLGRLLGEKIELSVVHGRDLWLVKADLLQFEQVIINLAVNARDAMPDGGKLTIRTANVSERESRLTGHSIMQPGEYVLCEVTDTGYGMTKEVMDKVFEPFFTTKEVGKGTGLGLSTVYGIIKQTGGYIFPESEPGKGTTFRIYLPRHIPDVDEIDAARHDRRTRVRDLTGTGTVLLVEDEEAVRSFAARALSTRGYKVLQAATGAEALNVLSEHKGNIDLVISDVVMPEMDGPTLLRQLRRRQPDIKIIFISGYAEDAFSKSLGEDDHFVFLPKPFSLKQLAEAVKETLEGEGAGLPRR